MPRARFLGTGFAVPDRVVTNDDLSTLMDTTDEWIRARTGIQERHWVREGESGAELARAAAGRALEMAGSLAIEQGDHAGALRQWRLLMDQLAANDPRRPELARAISRVERFAAPDMTKS